MTVKISTTFAINGERHTVNAASDTPLLWVLREQLKLTGTKFGCGVAACGACTSRPASRTFTPSSAPMPGVLPDGPGCSHVSLRRGPGC